MSNFSKHSALLLLAACAAAWVAASPTASASNPTVTSGVLSNSMEDNSRTTAAPVIIDSTYTPIVSGETYYQGQLLSRNELIEAGAEYELVFSPGTENEIASPLSANDEGVLKFGTDERPTGSYVIRTTGAENLVPFSLQQQNLTASFGKSTVENGGSNPYAVYRIESNREGYPLILQASHDGTAMDIDTLQDILNGRGTIVDVNNDGTGDFLSFPEAPSILEFEANFSAGGGISPGNVSISALAIDTGIEGVASIEVQEYDPGDVSFDNSFYNDHRGDKPVISASLAGTDQAVVIVGSEAANYKARVTLTDENGDGTVRFSWNTYKAGRVSANEVFSGAEKDGGTSVQAERIVGDFSGDTYLAASEYNLSATVGGVETDFATLILEEPRLASDFKTLEANSGLADGALSNSEISSILSNDTPSSTLAEGDYLVLHVETDGVFGYLSSADDLTNSTGDGLRMQIGETQESTPPNESPELIDPSAMTFFPDPNNNAFYLIGNTSTLGGGLSDDEIQRGGVTYEARFYVKGDENPYTGGDLSVGSTFSIEPANATVEHSDGNTLAMNNEPGQTVNGQTNLADGTVLDVMLRSIGNNPFLKPTTTMVSNGSFNAEFDLSDVPNNTEFTITIENEYQTLRQLSGVIESAAGVTFNDQTSQNGETVTVESAYLPSGGFVVIHDASFQEGASPGGVIGASSFLQPGTHNSVSVTLNSALDTGDHTLYAVPHRDTDGQQAFDYVSSSGQSDQPYQYDGQTVSDPAVITVGTPPKEITVQEQISVGDQISTLKSRSITVTESISVQDAVSMLPPVSIDITENISVSDSTSVKPPKSTSLNEQIAVSDQVTIKKGKLLVINEQITVDDSVSALPPASIDITENIGVSDSVALAKSVHLLVTENISVSDSTGTATPKSINTDWAITVTDSVDIKVATGIAERDGTETPDDFKLHANYPNPFNPSTTIQFDLPEAAHVTLTIYALNGTRIAQLIDKQMNAGRYNVEWNADRLSSGIYLYRLEAGSYSTTQRMTLLK